MNIFNALILCGCIQGILLSGIVYSNRSKNNWAYTFLALFLFTFALSSVYHLIIDVGWNEQYPSLYTLPISWNMLTPVALYLFVQHMRDKNRQFLKADFKWFIPFILQMGIEIPIFITALLYPNVLEKYFHQINLYYFIETILATGYAFVLLIILVLQLRGHEATIKENYSNINEYSLQWLQLLLFAMTILWLLWALPVILGSILNVSTPYWDYGFWILMAIVIYWIGYSAYSKRMVFESVPQTTNTPKEAILSENAQIHHRRLLDIMTVERLYKDSDLNLERLANRLSISPSYLSQIINKISNQSFYEFINRFRIEHAKELLVDGKNQHLSVDGIGYEAGFKSRSTFYAQFKRLTGQSPAQFRKKVVQNLSE